MVTIIKNKENKKTTYLSNIYGFVTNKGNVYLLVNDEKCYIIFRNWGDCPIVEDIDEDISTLEDFKNAYLDNNEIIEKIFEESEDFEIKILV